MNLSPPPLYKWQKYFAFVVLFCWVVIEGYLYLRYGGRTSVDSQLYIDDGKLILTGRIQEGRSLWYAGYSAFVGLILAVGGTVNIIALTQIILSGLATYFIFLCGSKIFENTTAGLVVASLLVLWIPIHEWNTYIYTESLFTSFCIFTFAALVFANTKWDYLVVLILFLITFFIRPTGFCFVLGMIGYFLPELLRRKTGLMLIIFVAMIPIAWLVGDRMFQSYDQIRGYVEGEVIYPGINLLITPPEGLVLAENGTPLEKIFQFAFQNPVYFTKLFFLKILLFFGNIKPYYSMFHNLMIVLILYPIYVFAARAANSLQQYTSEKYFIGSFILVNGVLVGLTTENYDGRFLIPVLPFIFLMASGSIAVTSINYGSA